MYKHSLLLLVFFQPAYGIITNKSMSYTLEERINNSTFAHQTTIINGERSSTYRINSMPVEADAYEEALLNAEKAESKQRRAQAHEQHLQAFEIQYRGQIRLSQAELRKSTEKLVQLLKTALDSNLEQFRSYSPETIPSQEALIALAENLLPTAKQLYLASPEKVNLQEVAALQEQLTQTTEKLHTFITNSVNNGINNAHDTKLLKELLQLATTL